MVGCSGGRAGYTHGRVWRVVGPGGRSGRAQGLRSHPAARSGDHCQPGGILRIRRRAWVITRAGADRMRKRRVLVAALASSPSRAR